ncbi:MAG: M55 family metallopeptidase [bacterium]
MKIYISVDMEGIGGITIREQVFEGNKRYEEACYLMLKEANAAAEGAMEGGAAEVIVADMHAKGHNFPVDELDPRFEYIMGGPHRERFPFLEGSDGLMLVGYHAMSGTLGAVRDHTMSSIDWQDFYLNGRAVGEVGIDAAIAGYFGIPVILVSGDDKVCAEARELLGDVETAEVKRAVARHRAKILAPAKSRDVVRKAAERAVRRVGEFKPYRVATPVTVKLRYSGTDIVDAKLQEEAGGVVSRRLDGRTMLYTGDDLLQVLGRALH